jgi:hypothetical protein
MVLAIETRTRRDHRQTVKMAKKPRSSVHPGLIVVPGISRPLLALLVGELRSIL